MTEEEMNAFKSAWSDYPSQDNEGYSPDRGGFKTGWAAALEWTKKKNAQAIRDAVEEELGYLESRVQAFGNAWAEDLCPPPEPTGKAIRHMARCLLADIRARGEK